MENHSGTNIYENVGYKISNKLFYHKFYNIPAVPTLL